MCVYVCVAMARDIQNRNNDNKKLNLKKENRLKKKRPSVINKKKPTDFVSKAIFRERERRGRLYYLLYL